MAAGRRFDAPHGSGLGFGHGMWVGSASDSGSENPRLGRGHVGLDASGHGVPHPDGAIARAANGSPSQGNGRFSGSSLVIRILDKTTPGAGTATTRRCTRSRARDGDLTRVLPRFVLGMASGVSASWRRASTTKGLLQVTLPGRYTIRGRWGGRDVSCSPRK